MYSPSPSDTIASRRRLHATHSHRFTPSSRKKWFFWLCIALIVICWYAVWSVGSTTLGAKNYTIDKGVVLSSLDQDLSLGIAPWRYKLWVRFFAPSVTIQAGTYTLKSPTSLRDFLTTTLKSPTHTDLTITLLPGWSSYDIDAYLTSKNLISPGDFLQAEVINFSAFQSEYPFLQGVTSLEGFLYPDTYRIRPDATPSDIIRLMLGQFAKKIGPEYMATGSGAYRTLILASIVEREERSEANQAIVAGILEKRYNEGIMLGADATICYGYAKTQKQCTPAFIASVIEDPNPYNTRKTRGYPPTPIASISESTWEAAAHPTASAYYYYLHDSDGQIHYATTLAGHNANKSQYIQ